MMVKVAHCRSRRIDMQPDHLLNQIEAVLFASEAPVPALVLRQLLDEQQDRQMLNSLLAELNQRYCDTATRTG